jgi:hypothetical protein
MDKLGAGKERVQIGDVSQMEIIFVAPTPPALSMGIGVGRVDSIDQPGVTLRRMGFDLLGERLVVESPSLDLSGLPQIMQEGGPPWTSAILRFPIAVLATPPEGETAFRRDDNGRV